MSAKCMAVELVIFGWTTFGVLAQSQTLPVVNTKAGACTHASMMMMSRYHAFQQ